MQAAREHRLKQQGRKGLQNASASIEEVPDDTSADVPTVNSSAGKGSSLASIVYLVLFYVFLSVFLFRICRIGAPACSSLLLDSRPRRHEARNYPIELEQHYSDIILA